MNTDDTLDPLDPQAQEETPVSAVPEDSAPSDEAPDVDASAPIEDTLIAEAAAPEQQAESSDQAEPADVEVEAVELPTEAGLPEEEPETAVSYDLPQALFDAGIDVEAALGALSFELSTTSTGEDEAPAAPRLPPFTPPHYRPRLPMPPSITLRRGQIGSVLPALILIGLGAWLTLSNTSGVPVDPALVGLILAGGVILSCLALWLTGGRWTRGLLLVALVGLIGGIGSALVLQSGAVNALLAYPLLLAALGLAVILSALLARPVERAMLGPGLVFITAGITGFLVLNGAIPASVLSAAVAYWFVPAALVVLLLLLPLIVRNPARR